MSTSLSPGGHPSGGPPPRGQSEEHRYSTVYDPNAQAGLEVANPRSPNQDKYWVPPAGGLSPSVKPDEVQPVVQMVQSPERKIMGMRKTTFFLSVLLALVSILAGVVGGVVGTREVEKAKT